MSGAYVFYVPGATDDHHVHVRVVPLLVTGDRSFTLARSVRHALRGDIGARVLVNEYIDGRGRALTIEQLERDQPDMCICVHNGFVVSPMMVENNEAHHPSLVRHERIYGVRNILDFANMLDARTLSSTPEGA